MILKNTAAQGVYLYSFILATGLPKTGDAANTTGSYTLDGTDHTGFGTANPTEIGGGVYWQPLAQGETNANAVAYRWASSTSGVQIAPVFVLTTGVNLPVSAPGAANGLFIAGTNAATSAASGSHWIGTVDTITTYTGDTPQTGDNFARLGAPAGASVSADIAAIKGDTGTILTDVNSGAGAIYSRLGAPAGASMSADIASVKTSVGAVTGAVGSVTGNVGGSVGSLTLSQVLGSPRALDSIADGSMQLNDALWSAIGAGVGKKDASGGTSYIVSTPSTGTVLRTYALTLISPPATIPDKAV